MLVAEPFAGAANATDNLVDMQQDVVLFADLLNTGPIAIGSLNDAAACGDGFEAQGTNGVGAFAQDDRFDLVSCPFAVVLFGRPVLFVLAVLKSMGDAHETRCVGPVLCVAFVLTART